MIIAAVIVVSVYLAFHVDIGVWLREFGREHDISFISTLGKYVMSTQDGHMLIITFVLMIVPLMIFLFINDRMNKRDAAKEADQKKWDSIPGFIDLK